MLESVWHQGTGLHWQGAQSSLRVLPVVPSGDSADATALWMACAQLQQQGYPVVVLDGTEQESPSLPGLQDMLQPRQGYAFTTLTADISNPLSVATLPAARGMVQLQHKASITGERPLDLLFRFVQNHAVVVLWAPASLLAGMLQGCTQPPIQLVPSQSRNVVSSYRALKQLYMGCGLMPRLVALRPAGYGLDHVLKSLSQCAMRHLHTEPLCEQFDPLQARQLQRWALQCLEHSETVNAPQDGATAGVSPLSSSAVWSH
ncbi:MULTISPECIES: hypothetical protein [Comamonas]|uniref:Uncharacterized protein n=1 Tax=Comamonas avium TaxID=2762231 RepID=A0ABR8S8N3_9BURK|nr:MULTISPECIES: hypothetical protein [Comamonas]MBD7959837.1 hypothetical protein [Comamonas avium]MBD9403474.1 hypothetical protein [Comamonas sp. CMM02]